MTRLTVLKPKNTLETKLTQRKSIPSCHLSCSSSFLHFLALITWMSPLPPPLTRSRSPHPFSHPRLFTASILLSPLCVRLSISLSLPPHFKRTNVSCSHCSTALVFRSQFSRGPGGSSCLEEPRSNPTQGRQRESRRRLEELKVLRNKREAAREKQPCKAVQRGHHRLCCGRSKQLHFRHEKQGIIFLSNSTGEKATNRQQLRLSQTLTLSTCKPLWVFDTHSSCKPNLFFIVKMYQSHFFSAKQSDG